MKKSLIIQTKGTSPKLPTLDFITNAFEDLGKLLGNADRISVHLLDKFDEIKKYDLIWFECSINCKNWTDKLNSIIKKKRKDSLVIGSVGPISRLLLHIDGSDLVIWKNTLKKCDIVMCMNRDEVDFISNFLPHNNVVYLPVPIDPTFYLKGIDLSKKDVNKYTLCMHTDLHIIPHGKRGDISTLVLWKKIKEIYPNFSAQTWVTAPESGCKKPEDILKKIKKTLSDLDIVVDVKHSGSDFLKLTPETNVILQMTLCHAQSRISMYGAVIKRPVISSGINETHKNIWPYLCVDWHDHSYALELFHRLVNNSGFYEECIYHAENKIKKYYPEHLEKHLESIIRSV